MCKEKKVLQDFFFFLHKHIYLNGPFLDLCFKDTARAFLKVTFMDTSKRLSIPVLQSVSSCVAMVIEYCLFLKRQSF